MNNQFIIKVKYTKQLENGTFKRVNENFLFFAYTFTDAETRVYEELGALIRGEFQVVSITRAEFHDIFHYEGCDVWYKAAISFKTEEDSKSKNVKQSFLISAVSVKDADTKLKESLQGLMVDYTIDGIVVTNLIDIYPFTEELDKEISRVRIEDQTEEDYKETETTDVLN